MPQSEGVRAGLTLTHDPNRGCLWCPLSSDRTCEATPSEGERDGRPLEAWDEYSAPDWCPLRQGPVTIAPAGEEGER